MGSRALSYWFKRRRENPAGNTLRGIFSRLVPCMRWCGGVLCGLFCLWLTFSCRQEYSRFDEGEVYLRFSQDTVRFDTVFTTMQSVTQRITVQNPSKDAISIDRIYLAGGGSSRFRINVSGDTSLIQNGVVIGGQDSLYIFINVAIDYRDQNAPFEIQDYIKFELNGMPAQQVVLTAWGQDAHYLKSDKTATLPYRDPADWTASLEPDSVRFSYFIWNPEDEVDAQKPYVIYGYLTVPSGQTLRLPAGSRFYFARNSGLWIQSGAQLLVEGTLSQPVLFTSLRQDGDYRDMAGQWGRIWMDGESGPHRVEYALIRNAETALWLDSCVQTEGGLYVANTRIENMSKHGILSKQNKVEGVNLCISSAQVPLMLAEGGSYDFRHGTFVSRYMGGMGAYSQALVLTNHRLEDDEQGPVFPITKAEFSNSVFYGSSSRQMEFDLAEGSVGVVPYRFHSCLISMMPVPDTADGRYNHCLWNQEPLFVDEENYNFEIDTIISPLVGKGDPAFATGSAASDIKGVSRAVPPCIGAYEFVQAAPAGLRPFWRKGRD